MTGFVWNNDKKKRTREGARVVDRLKKKTNESSKARARVVDRFCLGKQFVGDF